MVKRPKYQGEPLTEKEQDERDYYDWEEDYIWDEKLNRPVKVRIRVKRPQPRGGLYGWSDNRG